MDDPMFRELANAYPLEMVWRLGLPGLWDEISTAIGHPVAFLPDAEHRGLGR